jgi:hypothetical protein
VNDGQAPLRLPVWPAPHAVRACVISAAGTSAPETERRSHERSHTDAGANATAGTYAR